MGGQDCYSYGKFSIDLYETAAAYTRTTKRGVHTPSPIKLRHLHARRQRRQARASNAHGVLGDRSRLAIVRRSDVDAWRSTRRRPWRSTKAAYACGEDGCAIKMEGWDRKGRPPTHVVSAVFLGASSFVARLRRDDTATPARPSNPHGPHA